MSVVDNDFDIDEFLDDNLDEEDPTFRIPDIAGKPLEYVIDRAGVIKDRLKRLKKYEKMFTENIKSRMPTPQHVDDGKVERGNRFEAVYTYVPTRRFDQKVAATKMSPEDFEACKVDSPQRKLLIKAL